MAEQFHRNPDARALQMIGATERCSNAYAWFFGDNHDYFMEFGTGLVVAEITRRLVQGDPLGDALYGVTYLGDIKIVEKTDGSFFNYMPLAEFFTSRSAARARVEDHYNVQRSALAMS
jgi:hypothetical protein